MTAPGNDPEVLVIGAGPVGMMTALGLSERGVRVEIVDKYRRAALHSYALALHPQSLELLDEYGLADSLVQHGQRLNRIVIYTGRDQTATIDLSKRGGRFPFVLVLPQELFEGALETRLADNGTGVFWGHPVLTFEDDGDGVTTVIAELSEDDDADRPEMPARVSTARVRSSYVIGADGYDSLTRRLLSVPCRDVGEVLRYGLVEFESSEAPRDEMTLVFGDESTDVLWPLGGDRARWGFQVENDASEVDAARLWEIARGRVPWFDTNGCRREWVTTVAFQPRVARQFGHARVWLAGDSAHLTAPAGVQSMNIGLREGHDLARRLAGILRERSSPRLLRYYNEEREREWKMLLGIHDRLRQLPGAPDWARRLGHRLVPTLPSAGRDLNILLEQVGLRLHWLRGEDGARY